MILQNIPPGLTTTITLYVRNSDNTVGSVVETYDGTSSGSTYTFNLEGYSSGDYYAVLGGVGDPVGAAFPVRDDVAYFMPWELLDMITLTDAVVVNDVTQPTAASGNLTRAILINDDYPQSVGRNFEWQVNAVTGYTAAELTCWFKGWLGDTDGWLVQGTVTTITGGLSLKFNLPHSVTSALTPGWYMYSVYLKITATDEKITRVISIRDDGSTRPVLVAESKS
jgi:hypothetical protein